MNDKEFKFNETQVRSGAALILVLLCLAVVVGYYWGKKRAYEEFLEGCRSDSLSDKIAASLCSLYDADQDEDSAEGSESQDTLLRTTHNGNDHEKLAQKMTQETEALYFAELAGFGSARQAKDYVKRLQQRSIKAHMVEHVSRSARGKIRTWYQVVTAPMGYDELQALVDAIKTEDRLQGVTLVEYTRKHKEYFERSIA
jgi:hypothetical protein